MGYFMIKPSLSSHWYTRDGEPAYNATLRDARKENLYPSVTQVLGILAKPAVESWAVNLMSETCFNNPRQDESLEEYRDRIEPIYEAKRGEAAIRGSAIHDFAEAYLNGDKPEPVEGYEIQCINLADWLDTHISSAICEKTFAFDTWDNMGYGGRIDAHGTLKDGRKFLLDFKTQDLKGKKSPTFYPEWKYQLGAYHTWLASQSIDKDIAILSVVIDTSPAAGIHVKEYLLDDIFIAFGVFTSALVLFYELKGLT